MEPATTINASSVERNFMSLALPEARRTPLRRHSPERANSAFPCFTFFTFKETPLVFVIPLRSSSPCVRHPLAFVIPLRSSSPCVRHPLARGNLLFQEIQ